MAHKIAILAIKNSIDQDKYVLIMINRKYINHYGYLYNNMHQLLIHGYEDKNFIYADHDNVGKYRVDLRCSFNEFKEGYKKRYYIDYEPDFGSSIFLFKPNKEGIYPLDLERIKREILEYIHSAAITNNNFKSGIQVYDDLIVHYENTINDYNVKGLCTLYDQKKAMYSRINEFINRGYMPIEYASNYYEVLNMSLLLLNCLIKMSIKREYAEKKIIEYLRLIKEKEYTILGEIINYL